MIADENSNVHLPVLKLGIPTVAVKGLGLYPESRSDMYGFAAAASSSLRWRPLSEVRAAAFKAFFSRRLGRRFRAVRRSIFARRPKSVGRSDRQSGGSSTPRRATYADGEQKRKSQRRSTPRAARLDRAGHAPESAGQRRVAGHALPEPQYPTGCRGPVRADKTWLVISVGMILPITYLRAVRFYWVAPAGALPGTGEAFRLTLVASALNVVLPAKAGDLVKGYFVATRSTRRRYRGGNRGLRAAVRSLRADRVVSRRMGGRAAADSRPPGRVLVRPRKPWRDLSCVDFL